MGALRPLGIDPALFIAYFINFLVLIFLLRLFLYRPVLGMLKARQEKIEDGLKQAQKARQEAEIQRQQFQRELEEARKTSQEAARRQVEITERMREEILQGARKESEQLLTRARQEIEIERQRTFAELQRQIADLAIEISKKTIGQTIDENAQRGLIQKILAGNGDGS